MAVVALLAMQNAMLLRELRHVHKASEAAEELSAEAVDRLTVAQPVAAQPVAAEPPGPAGNACMLVIHHRDGSTEERPCDPVEAGRPVEVRVETSERGER